MRQESVDQKIQRMLLQQEEGKSSEAPKQYGSAFLVNIIFKAVPICLMVLKLLLTTLLGDILLIELVLIFVVIDFWLTKNVTGKKMVALRWSFEQDEFGDERFQFEGRVNSENVSSLNSKLFWLIQVVYTVVPIVFIFFGLFSMYTQFNQKFTELLLWLSIFIGGAVNLYFFWKASSGVSSKREELTSKIGADMRGKLGLATVISYI